ncbi:OmpP1/FadL family transporter [Tichowtungia aerotolerans]|uniref:Transporter n=1 Tax=Tichowtungia aerotolerans TaxID=2697043 RepID=A0A6P1M4N1_9BACT|nr:OmpP1/FadL family transporter [Tichowtungia aerotolerans]QHI68801.1 hypothetical protein GT409_04840 [Tichowtungia aerotolerans]
MIKRCLMMAGLLAASGSGFGAGFQLYTEGSAEALGQAGAVSGCTNLTSLAWYNPAALAGSKNTQVMAGNTFALIDTDFNSALNPALDSEMEHHWRSIPHFYTVLPVSDKLTGMLSVNAPYGLVTEWKDSWAGSPAATRTELSTIYTTPALAFKLTDRLSVAAGFNVVYAEADLQAYRGAALGMRKLTGDDIGYGGTASAHWQVNDDWGVGARYQSRVELKLDGDVEYENNPGLGGKFGMTGKVTLPSSVNVGVANSSFEKLRLGLDVVWSEWSTYDALVYVFPTNPYEGPVESNPKRWKDVWSVRIGGEYDLTENWVLRGGYVWDESPVDSATLAPELPGSDRHMLTTGIGWKGERIGIDLAYSFLWAEDCYTGSGVVSSVPTSAGEYETETHLVALSASYEF